MSSDRHDRLIREQRTDAYRPGRHPPEPAVCEDCRALWRNGRWQWADSPADAASAVCPACERIRDRYPAGCLTLEGGFLSRHRDEVLNLVRNTADLEQRDRPLNRIMDIEDAAGRITVTTTDGHLPRRIGKALQRAYDGTLTGAGEDGGNVVRVTWHRDG